MSLLIVIAHSDALSPLISALATGNAIVIKPSELVAWSTLHYMRAVKSCLVACGEDPDLVQCIVTRPRDVEALTGDPRIKHITFVSALCPNSAPSLTHAGSVCLLFADRLRASRRARSEESCRSVYPSATRARRQGMFRLCSLLSLPARCIDQSSRSISSGPVYRPRVSRLPEVQAHMDARSFVSSMSNSA